MEKESFLWVFEQGARYPEDVSGRSQEHGVEHLVFGVPAYIPQHQPSLWPDDDQQTLLERHRLLHHFLGISSERETADKPSNPVTSPKTLPPVRCSLFQETKKYHCESRLISLFLLQSKAALSPRSGVGSLRWGRVAFHGSLGGLKWP